MANRSVHFKKLSVERMYGHTFGLEVDGLAEGLNVIYGPNAAGKTSLARGLELMLWPAPDGAGRAMVSGQFEMEGDRWRVDLEAGHPLYQCNGSSCDAPTLPSEDHRERYQLLLPERLQAKGRNFARAVMQEAVGGIDVAGAADSLGFRKPSPSSGKATKDAERAYMNLIKQKQAQEGLDQNRRKLDGLRADSDKAKEAERRAAFLKILWDYFEAKETREGIEAELADYPEILEDITGEEPNDLKDCRKTLD